MKKFTGALLVLMLFAGLARADVRLPHIFGDHMVLQRNVKVPVWGWADPGERVTVEFAGRRVSVSADKDGKWMVKLAPLNASSEGRELTVSGRNTIVLKDVLVGEVWVCSGQSNMDFNLGGVINAQEEIRRANHPQIRHFTTGYAAPAEPAKDCQGQWVVCSPETAGGFTAVGYFFGLELHQALNVPVGLIKSAVGGTPVESWTGKEMMMSEPAFAAALKLYDNTLKNYPEARKKYEAEVAARDAVIKAPVEDKGWESPSLEDADWKTIPQPDIWENHGLNIDGVVWERFAVTIPQSWAGKELTLHLAPVDNEDLTYWNGTKVGEGNDYKQVRSYTVPASLVKAGSTVIAIRVNDTDGWGGINGKPEDMFLACAGQGKISLVGQWKYKIAFTLPPWPREPLGPGNAFLPTALYNGMIAPYAGYGIKGAIWYQGEGNESDKPGSYFYKMRGMIAGWRKAWGEGDFPFYYTQIANFRDPTDDPAGNDGVHWATVRQSQLQTLNVKHTGMAVTIDLADPDNPGDIHPKDKQDVGHRLALWALAKDYGQRGLVYSGPIYKSMRVEGDQIRLRFDCTGGGLVVGSKAGINPFQELKGAKLQCFAIAGADRKWFWANAVIDGHTVLVSSPEVEHPVAVRYAYSMNPAGNKLYNKEGLPASPFRTDNW
ncbi:MAG TPA: sialate O-acetylesterase [Verrucomicrobiae bacterium]|nr:sialate O-acetylesterase [Verrucomicrobiae bacterium]